MSNYTVKVAAMLHYITDLGAHGDYEETATKQALRSQGGRAQLELNWIKYPGTASMVDRCGRFSRKIKSLCQFQFCKPKQPEWKTNGSWRKQGENLTSSSSFSPPLLFPPYMPHSYYKPQYGAVIRASLQATSLLLALALKASAPFCCPLHYRSPFKTRGNSTPLNVVTMRPAVSRTTSTSGLQVVWPMPEAGFLSSSPFPAVPMRERHCLFAASLEEFTAYMSVVYETMNYVPMAHSYIDYRTLYILGASYSALYNGVKR
ncbi:hypothetical protein B0H10DRAFT_1970212 [Mycena sp. CBHHK59/15]|nr:hypothetical protein B0H10DRAFT_1970212 [Mycena sp. CBHHK59/15]